MDGERLSLRGLIVGAAAQRDWVVLLAYVVILAIAVVVLTPISVSTLLFVAFGVLAWVATEYVFHRFLLHLPLLPPRRIRRIQRRLHHKHHQIPGDPRYLFIPWWASPGLILLGGVIATLAFGPAARLPGMLGYGFAIVMYELTHYAAHVPYRPRTRWGAFMKRHHLLHHFKNERHWFGVTTPLGDLVARTWPSPDSVPKSPTARDLEGRGPDQS